MADASNGNGHEHGPVRYAAADGVAVLTIANPPVNALGAALRAGLAGAVTQAGADPSVEAVVVAAEGKVFIAGADISEFGKPPVPPVLPDLLEQIEAMEIPVVAAIGGTALGGGLELALACHARVAKSGAKLGLPEVKLGLIPGAGGTQRLPRLIGAAAALKLMIDGEPVTAGGTAPSGLTDAVCEGDPLEQAIAMARSLAQSGLRRSRDADAQGAREEFEETAAALLKRNAGHPSVAACVEAVRATFDLPFAEGQAKERAAFLSLVEDTRSKALRYVFFAERRAVRPVGAAADAQPRSIDRAAIIGGGTMGGGIAMCFANAGIPVTIIETGQDGLDRGLQRIAKNYDISVKRGSLSEDARDARLKLIHGSLDMESTGEADIVIEAVFEDMALKKDIFGRLGQLTKAGTILATNTSYLDVNEIANASGRPEDVLGLHFFSPANVMRLLEVVRGEATDPAVLATAMKLGSVLGKLPVMVGVCHGFVGNRMLAVRNAQAEQLLLEGALPQNVDRALTAFGFRMGPFATSDMAGLDIGWRMRQATGQSAPVADTLCEMGRFGQKAAKGFYRYEEGDRTPHADEDVSQLIERISADRGVSRRSFDDREIVQRLVYPMINEGAKILEEGIANSASDIDVIWLNGYGWPAWRGGPMYLADQVGLQEIARYLEDLADELGLESLRPSALLRQLAAEGRGFSSD
ncbi:3-hydroxyacyl-CoA dehydrogenase NAD-binding domain-containing protein [Sphingopyxis granuli]|uniref:Enoyl-CoA hydratase/3-hydroxyacyl-CoA dehydrogenase-like protein n=2 Tax=Sphingopyxis TaxID=165697 RepID=D9PTM8_SPHMC|nr:3-hydroxyacyl-CoA dehydrogenase NAD-binding domain-containing protein [Sphingopyxis granuli]ADK93988.1 enoyl-CoA hydratase/3-hydroxyacyl-CoA dehydrogenase-like protein [Sphingopyxis macrogoltabida]AMG75138.1 Enoyl-CoA hydratase/3-hydroxyacyl-CoA dehydrogenase-like protein [Sphingopyxis granuli]